MPYSSAVNVGRLIYDTDPDYLVDQWPIQSRKAVFTSKQQQEFDHWADPTYSTGSEYGNFDYGRMNYYSRARYRRQSDCEADLPSNNDWSNDGSPTVSTSTFINSNGQQVTRTKTTQPRTRTEYKCWRKKNKRYYLISQTATRDFYTFQDEIRDPVYKTSTTKQFEKWNYKQVTYDTSVYKTFAPATTKTGPEGTDETSTWDGCIEERKTVATPNISFMPSVGIRPADAFDLDIDSAPDYNDDNTKWAPMWPEVAYLRTDSHGSYAFTPQSDYGRKAHSSCPYQSQLLTEMTQDEFDSYADSMKASGNTYLDMGMLWGGRISSPDGIFADNVKDPPYNGAEVSRHIIFMTDGYMQPYRYLQGTYGIEFHDRRITNDGGADYADYTARHTARFLALCQAIKAKGIRIWVIAFTSGLSSDLSTCASDSSSFTANSAEDLNQAFQEIAKQVGELRITK